MEECSLAETKQEFHRLLSEVLTEIGKVVKNGEISLSKIVRKIIISDSERLGNITECKTVDELKNSIEKKCDFLDGHILHGIVKYGLPQYNGLVSRAEKYMERVKAFQLIDLKDKINEKTTTGIYLVVGLSESWWEVKTDHLIQLIRHLVDLKDIRLIQVVSSSVKVTFLISEDDQSSFNITEQKAKFMNLIGMFYLRVGENPPIFKEEKNLNFSFENGLLEAAKTGHVQAIEFILSIGINVDYQDDKGSMALILASEHGHSEAVELILSAGASVDIQDNNGLTAVMVAKTVDIYQTLVQANANTNIVTRKGSTPLIVSCILGNHDVANYLLFTLKHNITTRPDGVTLLMAASYGGNNKIVEYLLNNGHDPNIQDNDGRTAIELSRLKSHSAITEILLKHTADNRRKPSEEGHHDLLLKKGVNPKTVNDKHLIQASPNGNNETFELSALNGVEINRLDNELHDSDPSSYDESLPISSTAVPVMITCN